jgi:hypothetical protein
MRYGSAVPFWGMFVRDDQIALDYLCRRPEVDVGSPADGVRALERAVGSTYEALGASDRFRSVLYPEVGHSYTPEMRAEVLAWFARWLRPETITPVAPR